MKLDRYLLALVLLLLTSIYSAQALNIALHAQVSPASKIVGSVITTDGIRTALERRKEVSQVSTFYAYEYEGFFNHTWDLIIIEGWFTLVDDFIHIARSHNPSILIFYYCLDPEYPGMDTVTNLDVDAYMTNSKIVLTKLQRVAPALYLPLAADIDAMKPQQNISREYAAVYVGAGGHMLEVKPLLADMLERAVSHGLLLYGSHWDDMQSAAIKHAWQGKLTRGGIATAYARAHAVLACTIDSQREAQMVNNRVFEALACGAVVISDNIDAVKGLFGEDVVLFAQSGDDVDRHLRDILAANVNGSSYYDSMRERARYVIVNRHTWDHRVVEILDFYYSLVSKRSPLVVGSGRLRHASPKMLWIVSDNLVYHLDYVHVVIPSRDRAISGIYDIHEYTISSLKESLVIDPDMLLGFDVIATVFSPYDDLHRLVMDLKHASVISGGQVQGRNKLKKWLGYVFGFPSAKVSDIPEWYESASNIFDVILYRDIYERDALINIESILIQEKNRNECTADDQCGGSRKKNSLAIHRDLRWQHCFGTPSNTKDMDVVENALNVVVCINSAMDMCTRNTREKVVKENDALLLLMGGEFSDWLVYSRVTVTGSLESIFISGDNMSNVVHIGPGRVGRANEIFSRANKVYLMYSDDNADANVLWPFVYAAVSGKQIHMLVTPGPHVSSLLLGNSDCTAWTSQYLNGAWQTALKRLHGLATASSSVVAQSNIPNMSTLFLGPNHLSEEVLIIPDTQFFVPGRDGSICLQQDDTPLMCLLRPGSVFRLVFTFRNISQAAEVKRNDRITCEEKQECKSTMLSLFLRGNMFADTVYTSRPLLFSICDCLGRKDLHVDSSYSRDVSYQDTITVDIAL